MKDMIYLSILIVVCLLRNMIPNNKSVFRISRYLLLEWGTEVKLIFSSLI